MRFTNNQHSGKTIEERFWEKVDVRSNHECWKWMAGTFGENKYGAFSTSHFKTVGAHVFSWELHNKQKVPEGFFVLHECDNPPCVNPYHLFIGTPKDNTQDMLSKNRHHVKVVYGINTSQHGTKHWKNKLSENDVIQIRNKYANGCTQVFLAQEYGVTQACISRIIKRLTWDWLK